MAKWLQVGACVVTVYGFYACGGTPKQTNSTNWQGQLSQRSLTDLLPGDITFALHVHPSVLERSKFLKASEERLFSEMKKERGEFFEITKMTSELIVGFKVIPHSTDEPPTVGLFRFNATSPTLTQEVEKLANEMECGNTAQAPTQVQDAFSRKIVRRGPQEFTWLDSRTFVVACHQPLATWFQGLAQNELQSFSQNPTYKKFASRLKWNSAAISLIAHLPASVKETLTQMRNVQVPSPIRRWSDAVQDAAFQVDFNDRMELDAHLAAQNPKAAQTLAAEISQTLVSLRGNFFVQWLGLAPLLQRITVRVDSNVFVVVSVDISEKDLKALMDQFEQSPISLLNPRASQGGSVAGLDSKHSP